MSKPEARSAELRFFALWLAAGVLEAPALALMAGWPPPLPPALGVLAHIGAAALVFFAPPRAKGWLRRTRHWGEPLSLLVLLLPGLGWAASGLLLLQHGDAPLDKEAYRFQEEGEEETPSFAGSGAEELMRRELADTFDVLPAVDALLSDNPALKRGAIEALSRIRSPEAVAWLLRARVDRDAEIRFYATTALTRLKRDFETAIEAAVREAFSRPSELEPQFAVSRARIEYAAAGILDASARAAILEDCRRALEPSAERRIEAARLLYRVERLADPARALALLERLERDDEPGRPRWMRERVELLFSIGRHAQVRRLLRERRDEALGAAFGPLDGPDWRAAVLWWSHD